MENKPNIPMDNQDVKLALDEMRLAMEQTLSASDSLDQKTNNLLSVAALIMALAAMLQINVAAAHSPLFWVGLFITLGVFMLAIGGNLLAMRPQTYRGPIDADWKTLDKHLLGIEERTALLTLLSGYVDQVQHNIKLNRHKVKLHGLCLAAMGCAVTLLFFLTIIP